MEAPGTPVKGFELERAQNPQLGDGGSKEPVTEP